MGIHVFALASDTHKSVISGKYKGQERSQILSIQILPTIEWCQKSVTVNFAQATNTWN